MPRSPWSAVPAARSTAPVLKIRLVLVLGSLLLAAAMGVFSTLAWMSAPKNVATASAPTSLASTFAQTIAADYLAGQYTTLPATTIDASNDTLTTTTAGSSTPSYWPAKPLFAHYTLSNSPQAFATYANVPCPYYTQNQSNCTIEVHKFVVDTSLATYALYVAVNIGDPASPVLAAAPSLLPYRFDQKFSLFSLSLGTSPPPGVISQATAPGSSVDTAVQDWAKVFTGGTNDALYTLVTEQGHNPAQKSPLALTDVDLSAGAPASALVVGDYHISTDPSDSIVVQVSLLITSPSANGVAVRSDYDLVVSNTGGRAYVSNWGPAGSGPFLK